MHSLGRHRFASLKHDGRLYASIWLPTVLSFNFWVQRSLFPIFAPLLSHDLGFTYTGIGFVASGVLATTCVGYVLAGHFVRHHNIGTTFKMSLLLQAASSALTSLSTGLIPLMLFQAINGFAEGALFVGVVVLIGGFAVSDRSRVYGAFEACGNFGWFLALCSGGFLGILVGWRWSYLLLALPILSLLPFKIKPNPTISGDLETKGISFLTAKHFWLIALPIILFLTNWFAVWAFVPSFLVSKGFSLEQAGLTSALSIAFSVPAPFIVGSFIGRVKARQVAVSLLAVTSLVQLSLPLIAGKSMISLLVVTIGIMQASTSTTMFVLLTELVSKQSLPMISGWCVALGYGGAALGPVVFGKIADVAAFVTSFTTFAILNVLCLTVIVANSRRAESWSP